MPHSVPRELEFKVSNIGALVSCAEEVLRCHGMHEQSLESMPHDDRVGDCPVHWSGSSFERPESRSQNPA